MEICSFDLGLRNLGHHRDCIDRSALCRVERETGERDGYVCVYVYVLSLSFGGVSCGKTG